jgi:D-alanine-D-alanine ligase
MAIIKVGVLRGGPSSEYEQSLKTGKKVLDLLRHPDISSVYQGIDILVDKKGVWHVDGSPKEPYEAIKNLDVVFNALHGDYGEDGKLQHMLEAFAIPFTGSRAMTSAISMNKSMAKDHFKMQGIKTPYHKELQLGKVEPVEEKALDLFRSFPMPVVVKPRGLGGSIGVTHASNFNELVQSLEYARLFSPEIIVEEYITGKEIVSGMIEDFRGTHPYVLMPVEVDKEKQRQDAGGSYNSKKIKNPNASPEHRTPAALTDNEKKIIKEAIEKIQNSLDLKHYATADFIVSPRRGVYLIEVDTSPYIGDHGPLIHALKAAGIKEHDFIDHILKLALRG